MELFTSEYIERIPFSYEVLQHKKFNCISSIFLILVGLSNEMLPPLCSRGSNLPHLFAMKTTGIRYFTPLKIFFYIDSSDIRRIARTVRNEVSKSEILL